MASDESIPEFQSIKARDFTERYANNVRFENNIWDMRLLFGNLDQTEGRNTVTHHTTMSLSWPQAKLMLFYFYANLAFQERWQGKINVPETMIPIPMDRSTFSDMPGSKEFVERVEKFRSDL